MQGLRLRPTPVNLSPTRCRLAFKPRFCVVSEVKARDRPDAVIIGGGIAGLLTASVLSQRLDKVLLVEKDDIHCRVENETFKETAKRRHGVPHITQPHQLVLGAISALDDLLPNIRDEVIAAGGLDLDLGEHVLYYDYGNYFPRQKSGLKGLGVSRRFLEEKIRERVLKEGQEAGSLHFLRGKVADFMWDGDTVTGIKMADNLEIRAPLVVDATGRSSTTPKRLADQNLQSPHTLCVDPHVSSASRIVKRPKDWDEKGDWFLLWSKTQPHGTCGGALLPTENGCWQVTLAEIGGPGPEPTEDGFLEFAQKLPDQTLYNVLQECEPVTDVAKYMAMRNEMVCYHEISMPRGLVVIGDSVMRLNALYGQGIAASSQSVLVLRQVLDRALTGKLFGWERKEVLAGLGAKFQPSLAQKLLPAWDFTTKTDLKYKTTTANFPADRPSPERLFFNDALLTAGQRDPFVYHRALEVAHLAASPASVITNVKIWRPLIETMIKMKSEPRSTKPPKVEL